jgi:hypothetical protein
MTDMTLAVRQKPDVWRPRFLLELARTGNVSAAARKASITRPAAYQARADAPEFATAWDAAMQEAIDSLETAAWRRAKKSSDTLLMFLLKAHRPSTYRDTTRQEHTGADGQPIEVHLDVDSPSIRAWRDSLRVLGIAVDPVADAGPLLPASTD